MNLFSMFGGQGNRMMQMMNQLRQDPRGVLQQAGLNIPEDMAMDPQQIVMHLINSGQVNGPAVQRVMPMIRQMTGK